MKRFITLALFALYLATYAIMAWVVGLAVQSGIAPMDIGVLLWAVIGICAVVCTVELWKEGKKK